jgi:predicted DNA-binding protein (MmcQ/YjbR family)
MQRALVGDLVRGDGSVEDDVMRGMISDSYDLVVAGLPRSIRASVASD